MREHAAPELHGQEHDILDFRLQVALPVRRHPHGGLPEQVQCHRDVVRPKAPQGVLIGANLPQVDAQAIQVIDASQLPSLHQCPQPLDGRVKQQQVAGQNGDPPVGGRPRHGLGIAPGQGERLFHETGLSGLDTLQRKPRVRPRRRRDHHRVDPAKQVGDIGRDLRRRVLPRHALPHLGVAVAHRRQLRVRQARDGADMVPAPRPGADHAEPEPGHR